LDNFGPGGTSPKLYQSNKELVIWHGWWHNLSQIMVLKWLYQRTQG
jgi:hypothetical protein